MAISRDTKVKILICFSLVSFSTVRVIAEEWPQWRGPNRDGVWKESGIVQDFVKPLPVIWRIQISGGYCGPTVAGGRVYLMDRIKKPDSQERVLCFNAHTGKPIWSYPYPCEYRNVQYTTGPRASVTINEDRAYALGTMGHFHCLDAKTGEMIWKKDLKKEYDIRMPLWGISSAPLIEKHLVILHIGGKENACLLALEKSTGKEVWRNLEEKASYAAPILIDQAHKRVVVCWTSQRLAGLDAMTGKIYWQHPMPPSRRFAIGIATPVFYQNYIFVSSFYDGSLLVKVNLIELTSQKIWRRLGPNEKATDSLHCCISTPLLLGDYIYGVDSYGQFRCLNLLTGDRVWESDKPTPPARWSNVHMVRNGERIWMFNERGDLIISKLSPQGYLEISRTKIIEPTRGQLSQRGGVCWSHPAYAYKRIYIRNDEELLCLNLSATQ